ncbi:MAG: virulence RhuM family protein [bacterium]
MDEIKNNENNIVFYTNDEGETKVEVILQNEDIWITQKTMADLFDVNIPAINKHLKNIYSENELAEISTISKMEIVHNEGSRQVKRLVDFYNLDAIIAVGYRVNSKKATLFRQWATKILKDYMIQGFALDDERFMKGKKTDKEYFKRLLERIKLIRTSERMFYQKITDVFSECSIDYDKNSETARDFYATVQNKLHYAITNNTAAEIIYNRVDSTKDNMGLTTWEKSPDGKILKNDIIVAKNYLNEKEIKELNNVVNMYLDLVENRAERLIPMKMQDWVKDVESILNLNYYEILSGKGKISAETAKKKALEEYDKYKVIQDNNYISDFDKLLLETTTIEDK